MGNDIINVNELSSNKETEVSPTKETVIQVFSDGSQVVDGQPAENKEVIEVKQGEPINIEITEYDTVEMEINGVTTVLYQGKPRPAPKPIKKPAPKKVVKPAPKAEPKPEPKPKPKPEPKPEPAPVVAPAPVKTGPMPPRRGAVIRKKNRKITRSKELADFGPGLTDDNQHSIHTIPFEEKVNIAPKDIKKKYKDLSAYLTDVYGCSHRISFGYDSYRVGKKVVVALSLGGVHLRVNAAIDPKFYEGSKLHVNDDSDSKKYKDMPSYIKVMSDKTYKQAIRLIDDTMKNLGVKKIKA